MRTRARSPKVLAFPTAAELAVAAPEMSHDAACPACRTPLDLHQPDMASPERLLGICPACRSWTLVDEGGTGRARLTLLPDPGRAGRDLDTPV